MKRKFLACAVALAAIVGSYNALAQSSAQPVLPGALSTTGCNTGLTVCFVAYPVDSNGYPYVDVGGGTGTVSVTATAGAFADGWNLTLGQKSDLQSPWDYSSAGTEMQAIAAIAKNSSTSTYPNPPVSFYQVTTTSAVALPSHALYNGLVCTAAAANTGTVYVGGSTVTAGTGTVATAGYPLKAGNSISYGTSNSNLVYIVGSDSSEGLNCTGS